MKRLSEEWQGIQKTAYSVCFRCNEIFLNDMLASCAESYTCPNKDCWDVMMTVTTEKHARELLEPNCST